MKLCCTAGLLLLSIGFVTATTIMPPWSCSEDWQFQSILQLCSSVHEPLMGACLMVSTNETVGKLCTCARRQNDSSTTKWSNCMGPCWHKLDAACAPTMTGTTPHNPVAGLDLRVCPPGTEYQFVLNSHVCGIVAEEPMKDEDRECNTEDSSNSMPKREIPDPSAKEPENWNEGENGVWKTSNVPNAEYRAWITKYCNVPAPTPLVAAVLNADREKVIRLLAVESGVTGGPTKATEGNGYENALMVAAELGLPEIVRTLVKNKKVQSVLNAVNRRLIWKPRAAALFMPTALTYAVAGWQGVINGYPVNHTTSSGGGDPMNGSQKSDGHQRVRKPPNMPENVEVDHAKVVEILLTAGASPFAGMTGAGPLGFSLELGLINATQIMLGMVDCGQLRYASGAHNEVDERTQMGKRPHANLVHAAAGTFSAQAELAQSMFRAHRIFDKHYQLWGKQLDILFDAFRRCSIDPKTRADEASGNDLSPSFPLAEAVMRCDATVSQTLLDAGADPFDEGPVFFASAPRGVFGPLIHSAAQVGCSSVVSALLSRAWALGGLPTMKKLVLQRDDMFQRVALQVAKDETVRCYLKKAALGIPPRDARCEGAQSMVGILQNVARGKRDLKVDIPAPKATDYGWRKFEGLPPFANDARPKCEVVEVDGSVESAEFFIKYHSSNTPVIFRGARSSEWNLEDWTPSHLKAVAGDERVSPKHIPYQFGVSGRNVTLATFLNEMLVAPRPLNGTPPWYLFDSAILKTNTKLAAKVKLPAMFGNYMREQSRQLTIGSEGSGSPVHFHSDFHSGAVNIALFGRKRWFFYPPGGAYWARTPVSFPTIPALQWYLDDGPQLDGDMHECIQEPGDIIFVPNSVGHAVLNLEDSVAVAMEVVQFSDPRPKTTP